MSTVVIVLLGVDIILCAVVLFMGYIFRKRFEQDKQALILFKKCTDTWHKKALIYKNERNRNIQRRADLELAILQWVHVTMKDYSDKQYGKCILAALVTEDKILNPEEESK